MTGIAGMGIDPVAAEQAAIAELMLHPDRVDDVAGWLSPEDFTWPVHAEMYRLILAHDTNLDEGVSPFSIAAALAADAEQRAQDRAVARNSARPAGLEDDDLLNRRDEIRLERERAALISRAYLAVIEVLDKAAVIDPVLSGRVVLDASVQRQLEQVGETIARIGVDGIGEPGALVDRSIAMVDTLREDLEAIRDRTAESTRAVDALPDADVFARYESYLTEVPLSGPGAGW